MAQADDPESRAECPPCRGTGRLTSNLGGAPSEVTCPWCGGSGRWVAGVDAQEQGVALRDGA